jgi:Arc/MetJ-type ribon-helix-helix transcriptional regulator
MSNFSVIRLPDATLDEIESFIESNVELGYTSVSDFVRDSIRRNLERLKKTMEK